MCHQGSVHSTAPADVVSHLDVLCVCLHVLWSDHDHELKTEDDNLPLLLCTHLDHSLGAEVFVAPSFYISDALDLLNTIFSMAVSIRTLVLIPQPPNQGGSSGVLGSDVLLEYGLQTPTAHLI